MSLVIFAYNAYLCEPTSLGLTWDTTTVAGNDADITRDETGDDGRYRGIISVFLSATDASLDNWTTFVGSVHGAADAWLFMDPLQASLYSRTALSIGTGNGSAVNFPMIHKYIKADTLVVMLNGVVQSSGYTLTDNTLDDDAAPVVHFTSAVTAGVVVTVTYRFYIPVRFVAPPPAPRYIEGGLEASLESLGIAEVYAGARLVTQS